MKIYTKTGDKGTTSLLSGERVPKDSLRVNVYGNVDELDSALGMARAFAQNTQVKDSIYNLQKLLGLMMADLSSLQEDYITAEHVTAIEQAIDAFDAQLTPLTAFIIPGDTQGAAMLDLARTVSRRTERLAITLAKEESVNPQVLIALNRISDYCFTMARIEAEL